MKRIFLSTLIGVSVVAMIFIFSVSEAARPPESYPLVCRGAATFETNPGPVLWPGCPVIDQSICKYAGFTFRPGSKPARDGLAPGECSWLDRAMRAGEPTRLTQPIEGASGWTKELSSSNSYWTFNVYNAGEQLQATGAERSKKPGIDVAKPGDSIPGGDKLAFAKTNFALAANGGKASASSASAGYAPSGTIDGDRWGLNFGKDGYWSSETGALPQWLEVEFKDGKPKTITEIDLFTTQDNYMSPMEPTPSMEFKTFGLRDFDVQFWNDSASVWIPIPGGGVRGNKLVWNQFNFPTTPITTSKIRVVCLGSPDSYSRITELEAWSK